MQAHLPRFRRRLRARYALRRSSGSRSRAPSCAPSENARRPLRDPR
jgi:hypothetical protein